MAGNLEVTDLPLIPAVDGADVYAAKNNLDYRVRTGEAGGLATLDGTGKLPTNQFPNNLTITNLTFAGTPQFIKADFSSATNVRAIVQTTTVNGVTNVTAVPNGTGTTSLFTVLNSSDLVNHAGLQVRADATSVGINSLNAGTGVLRTISFQYNGTTVGAINVNGVYSSWAAARTGELRFAMNNGTGASSYGGLWLGSAHVGFRNTTIGSELALLDAGGATLNTTLSITGDLNLSDSDVNGYTQLNLRSQGGLWQNGTSQTGYGGASSINLGSIGAFSVTIVSNNTVRMTWDASGTCVATTPIRTVGASAGLIAEDRTSFRSWMRYGSGDVMRFTNGSGDITTVTSGGVWTSANFIATSDKNLKTEITDKLARRDLADKLRLVSFIWKEDGRKDQGLIAQEVKEIAPEYVYEQDGILAIDKTNLLLECVVGLADRVRELEAK